MNKCEHGDKISFFCVTDNCQYKQGGGCELCLKKYHSHITHTNHLGEEEMQNLIKRFALDNAVKPKCRLLQESIYNYFNQIKTEISGSLDIACKNIINQIGYPYLFSTNTLSTYKRLKNKEYRKITQKECRLFYQIANKIQEKELSKEENRIYHAEIKKANDAILQLEGIIKNYERIIKNYHSIFDHDETHQQKVTDIIKSIGLESPSKVIRNSMEAVENKNRVKEMPKVNIISPATNFSNNARFDLKIYDAKATELKNRVEKVETQIEPLLPSPSVLLPPKVQRTRDVSLDKKMVKEHKFVPKELVPPQQQKLKDTQKSDTRFPNQNLDLVKLQLNNRQLGMNEKKKLLMDIMKQSERVEKPFQRFQSVQFSQIRSKYDDSQGMPKKDRFSTQPKSFNESKSSMSSDDLSNLEEGTSKIQENTKNYAFTKLPIEQNPKKHEQKQQINKKLIIIPTQFSTKGLNNKINEMDSPLYKKRRIQNNNESKFKEQIEQKLDLVNKKLELQPKNNKEVLEIKENEEKSLALLLKSLALGAEEAITYLESALKYADNNLSAAEYLTYIYLELNRPKDCLVLCNKFLEKIQNANEPDQLSVNLNNNKAAALNILGRYSEAILILEQCLKYKEKDTLYKNLGDSYFSIGMPEKAILNYQKSIKLNSSNDECHYNLAVCQYIQNNYQHSKLSIKRAIELHPKNESYLQLEGHIDAKIKAI